MPDEKRVNVPKVVSARRPQHKPKLGQHFLASDSYALQIVEALGDVSQSTVLEIGPGRGVLTSLLAKRVRRLIAVEVDRVLAAQLRLKFGMANNVEIIEADILAIDFDSLFGPKPGLGRPGIEFKPAPVKVVGNLPSTSPPTFFCACSNTPNISRALSSWCSVRSPTALLPSREAATMACFRPRRNFTPAWKSYSPYPRERLSLHPRCILPRCGLPCSLDNSSLALWGMGSSISSSLSFGQKRKTLWNNLKSKYEGPLLKAAMAQAQVKPSARAETLSLEESAALFRALRRQPEGS